MTWISLLSSFLGRRKEIEVHHDGERVRSLRPTINFGLADKIDDDDYDNGNHHTEKSPFAQQIRAELRDKNRSVWGVDSANMPRIRLDDFICSRGFSAIISGAVIFRHGSVISWTSLQKLWRFSERGVSLRLA